jgi:hypothetical protein
LRIYVLDGSRVCTTLGCWLSPYAWSKTCLLAGICSVYMMPTLLNLGRRSDPGCCQF